MEFLSPWSCQGPLRVVQLFAHRWIILAATVRHHRHLGRQRSLRRGSASQREGRRGLRVAAARNLFTRNLRMGDFGLSSVLLKSAVWYVGLWVGRGSRLLWSPEAAEIMAEVPMAPMTRPSQADATEIRS